MLEISANARDSASASTRELEIILKFLHPHCLLVHKVKIFLYHLVVVECPHHLTCHHH